MTVLFWLLAAAMLLVALALLLPALLGADKPAATGVRRDTLNIALYRDQLTELEAEREDGTLSPEQFEAARRELQRELLDEVGDAEGAAARVRGRAVVPVVALAVPLLAIGLYLQLGSGHLLTEEGQAELARAEQAAHDMQNVDQMVQQLATRLQQDPENLEGWVMLGRSLLALERYDDAARAFAQALRVGGEQPDLLADYAEALAMAGGGQLLGEPLQIVERVLAARPMHEKGLWLAGIAAFQRGDYAAALEHWNRLSQVIPEDHPNRRLLVDYLAQARNAVGGEGVPVAAGGDLPAALDAAIEVTVELDPALAARLAPGDTLFVYARAAQGPRMPLALVRQAAGDFPVKVTLDDSQAMAPTLRLSSFSEVAVGARVSRSGNATPQPGDLQGSTANVLVGADRAVTVVISEEVGVAEPQQAAAPAAPAAPTQPVPTAAPPPASAALEVAVTLDPALSDRVAPGDTLFVYARATQGPRMPLAIVRRQAGELPVTVVLDDSQAMAPNFRLSGFAEVSVGARISKSGDALPQPGDLQGQVAGVRVGQDRRVELTISEAL